MPQERAEKPLPFGSKEVSKVSRLMNPSGVSRWFLCCIATEQNTRKNLTVSKLNYFSSKEASVQPSKLQNVLSLLQDILLL